MNGNHTEQWRVIINDDLTDARRRLRMNAGGADHFLRSRIAENETILERLATIEHAASAREFQS
jgi:hypothetical protein